MPGMLILLLVGVVAHGVRAAEPDVDAAVHALTGGHTRLVWSVNVPGGEDRYALKPEFRLWGYDSQDGRGAREILGQKTNYCQPLLTPDGRQVVYSNRSDGGIYLVGFDGTGRRRISQGLAMDCRSDPRTGATWVYALAGDGGEKNPVVRFRLQDPQQTEKVWDKTTVGNGWMSWFEVSADGTRAGGALGRSGRGHCGVADLAQGEFKQYGGGCWPSFAPDNSYRFFHLLDNHREIALYDAGGVNRRVLNVGDAPGLGGGGVMAPRWSNHVRFLSANFGREKSKRTEGEVVLVKFKADFSGFEKAVRITFNNVNECFGDAWIDPKAAPDAGSVAPAAAAAAGPTTRPAADAASVWPSAGADAIFAWRNRTAATHAIAGTQRVFEVQPEGRARFAPFGVIGSGAGRFVARVDRADWQRVVQRRKLTIAAVVTADADPPPQQAQTIVSLGPAGADASLALVQQGSDLLLRAAAGTWLRGQALEIKLGSVTAGRPTHVAVVLDAAEGRITGYRDGRPVLNADERRAAQPASWQAPQLVLGGAWRGRIEGVYLGATALTAPQVQQDARALAEDRKARAAPSRSQVVARLIEVSQTPTLAAIAPYRQAMVTATYELDRVLSGALKSRQVLVAHWAILDGRPVPFPAEVGRKYSLTLEPFDQHSELEGEWRAEDSTKLDLDLYYQVELDCPAAP